MKLRSLSIVLAGAALALGSLGPRAMAVTSRPVLQDADVQKIVDAARAALAQNHAFGCIAIDDQDGVPLFLQRQDQAYVNCISSAVNKARTAALFQTPSATYHDDLTQNQLTMLAVPDLDPIPGGIPLYVGKTLVGAVAVSTPDGDIDVTVAKAAAAALHD